MPSLFLQLAQKVIGEEKSPMSANEIWEFAQAKGYDKDVLTKGKTPWATLGAMLYIDIRDNHQSLFEEVQGTRPKKYILKTLVDNMGPKVLETQAQSLPQKTSEYREKDLHPFLVYYGFYFLKAYLKTIHHTASKKTEFGDWVHPDIVGCYFPYSDWKNEVVDISSAMGDTAIKLFSFELKQELSTSSLRAAFFQAVSNSSWANEGYLAAAEIDNDEDFRKELERLSTSFGIGVIRIDIDDPDSSEMILPSRSKEVVDWETVNKLAGINPDFRDFLKRVKTDISSREVRKEMYDKVLEKEELIISLGKKK